MDLTALTASELIDEVTTWGARVARGEAVLTRLIGELDAREAWTGDGVLSCAHWLSWKLGWSSTTARERTRVARALRSLPLIAAAFGEGELSYSQVRAVTRVATPQEEQTWLDLARVSTGEQLAKVARGAARARAAETPAEQRRPTATVEWDDNGDLVLTMRVPAHQALLTVLNAHKDAAQAERDEALAALVGGSLEDGAVEGEQLWLGSDAPAGAPGTRAASVADVPELLAPDVARGYDPLQLYPFEEPRYPIHPDRMFGQLTDEEEAAVAAWRLELDRRREIRDAWNDRRDQLLREASARRLPTSKATLTDGLVRALTRPEDGPDVTVQLLVDPLSGWARSQDDELLPPATLADLLRSLPRKRTRRGGIAVLTDLHCFDQGRGSRTVSPNLRRLIGQIDGERCRFPGCSHTRFLHAHHIAFWSEGGSTDVDNLVLLCTRHHRLLHTAGYQLTLDADRTLHVRTPDGRRLEHRPALPDAPAGALPPAAPDSLPPRLMGDHLDLDYVVGVMVQHAA